MKGPVLLFSALVLSLAGAGFSHNQATPAPTSAAVTSAEHGKSLFEQKCSMCHNATSEDKLVGPGLKGIGNRKFTTTGELVTDEALTKWILHGDGMMPPFEHVLDSNQIGGIVAYLKTL